MLGKRVRITGLKKNPNYNNQRGNVISENDQGRWGVELDCFSKSLSIKEGKWCK